MQEEGKKEGEDEARLHNSLEEFLTISGGKTHKKIWGPKFVPNRPRSGLKLDFPLFPQVWFGISSSFSLHYIDHSLEQCLTSTGKTHDFLFSFFLSFFVLFCFVLFFWGGGG